METHEKKRRFVRLRAKGWSYARIAEKLKVAKGTCSAWEAELNEEISRCKREELEALYEEFGMVKTARIRRLGGILERIEATLAETDFAGISPEKRLELLLKYMAELRREYIPPAPSTVVGSNAKQVLLSMSDLLARLQTGEISESQAKSEADILTAIVKTIEVTQLQERLRALESLLKERPSPGT